MLDGLKRKIAATAVTSFLKSLATNKDTQTTIAGAIAGAVLAIPGLDMSKVIAGDPGQIGHLAAGLGVALIGFLATKENCDGHTTMLGTVAAAAYASSGSVEAVITGVVIAGLGYFTNKPVAAGGK